MSVTLEQIWEVSQSEVEKLLKGSGVDPNQYDEIGKYVALAQLYDDNGQLAPEASRIIRNPKFLSAISALTGKKQHPSARLKLAIEKMRVASPKGTLPKLPHAP